MTEVETPPGRSQRRLTARGIGSDGQRRKATREGLYKGVGESTYLKKSKVGVGGLGGQEADKRMKSTFNRSPVSKKGTADSLICLRGAEIWNKKYGPSRRNIINHQPSDCYAWTAGAVREGGPNPKLISLGFKAETFTLESKPDSPLTIKGELNLSVQL